MTRSRFAGLPTLAALCALCLAAPAAAGDGEGPCPVVFWELASDDADASVAFFREVFDWDIQFDDDLGFYRVKTGGGATAADGYIFTLNEAKLPFMAIYIHVKDIEAKARLVEEKGGLVVHGPSTPVPGGPLVCLFNDPSGATHAMIQPVPREPQEGE